ncbi:hypothetical protein MKX08_003670 [Trichoderma sp. CBMAI-0020]|nr:hypothetical protein MKX08_003670 [Trichoderma sp. CBMAI-0020]WOD46217.1 hypothetical protein [Trichoderma atroviride]
MLIWRIITAGFVPILVLVFSAMSNALDPNRFSCGATPSEQFKEISKSLAKEEAVARRLGRRAIHEVQVNVYMHIVASSEDLHDGNLSDQDVLNQFQVLKTDFEPTGIIFNLKSIDRTFNATWANNTDLRRMWYHVRNGSYSDLNLWFIPELEHYGYCTIPTTGDTLRYAIHQDGCTIRSDTVPGGRANNYNLGKTVTHEVGHWMGLLHTFQGGCDGVGDYIEDTPAQASPSEGCPEGRDSCPNKPGLDPIHNYMDYSYDACYTEFTPGQVDRMVRVWDAYRAWASKRKAPSAPNFPITRSLG